MLNIPVTVFIYMILEYRNYKTHFNLRVENIIYTVLIFMQYQTTVLFEHNYFPLSSC